MGQLFLFTKDEGVAKRLEAMGFVAANHNVDGWTFINGSKEQFDNVSSVDKKKIMLTNKLCI